MSGCGCGGKKVPHIRRRNTAPKPLYTRKESTEQPRVCPVCKGYLQIKVKRSGATWVKVKYCARCKMEVAGG